MKLKLLLTLFMLLAFAGDVFASNVAYATVVDSTPIYKTIRVTIPRQECWQEEVAYANHYNEGFSRSGGSTLVGGVIGGAFGRAVGHGKRNKQVGTLVGAVLGATIGNAYANQRDRIQHTSYNLEERCKVIEETHTEERIVGYNVRYRYSNVTYSTRTESDPGDTIKIRVAVTPVF